MRLHTTSAGRASVTCRSGEHSVSFEVTPIAPISSPSLQFEMMPIPSPSWRGDTHDDRNGVYDLRGNVAEWSFEMHSRHKPSEVGGPPGTVEWSAYGSYWSGPEWVSHFPWRRTVGERDEVVGLRVVRSVPAPGAR